MMLPAVYVTHPELFSQCPTTLLSSGADLRSGKLIAQPAAGPTGLDMPDRIVDVIRFKTLLVEAWDRLLA